MAELEGEMQQPGFWDDQGRAARVSGAHASAAARLSDYGAVVGEVDELAELAALLREEEAGEGADPGMVDELADGLERADAHLAQLEETRLFSGEHDAGNAVVSIAAGEGGTDAQDWAEMLLRMYLRWAERRGCAPSSRRCRRAPRPGSSGVTFTVGGPNAYGLMSAERGVHRLVRLSPFDAAHRRQTSFAAVQVAPLVDDAVHVEIDEKDLKVDTYAPPGRAAST